MRKEASRGGELVALPAYYVASECTVAIFTIALLSRSMELLHKGPSGSKKSAHWTKLPLLRYAWHDLALASACWQVTTLLVRNDASSAQ